MPGGGHHRGIKFKSKASEKAAKNLKFTENQATAILEMRLYRLIGLEIEALQAEYDQTMKNIASYEDILNNYDSMCNVIIEELDGIKKNMAQRDAPLLRTQRKLYTKRRKWKRQKSASLWTASAICVLLTGMPMSATKRQPMQRTNSYLPA